MRDSRVCPMALIVALSLPLRCYTSKEFPVNLADLDPLQSCKRRDVRLMEDGNKIYMYGGQDWVKNGTEKPFPVTNHHLRIVDFTASRNLNDTSILTVKDIPGNVTIFEHGAFWVDTGGVYIIGGYVNEEPWISRDGEFLESNYTSFKGGTVFRYHIDGDAWSSEPAVQPDTGSGVTDPFCCGSFAYNRKAKKAYHFSGTNASGARKKDPDSDLTIVGTTFETLLGNVNLLTFDTASFTWSNVTTDTHLTTTTTIDGQLVFLPGTESKTGGIAIALGGLRFESQEMESLRKVLVYDSATGSWYGQTTTVEGGGDYPPGRARFCVIATSAPDNSSHSIYMYGGESRFVQPDALDDMWILSIPSFHWIRVKVNSPTRKAQGCAIVGLRYMVTYGGVPSGWNIEGHDDDCDQENFGLRLFDLSELAWTTEYKAPDSQSPSIRIPQLIYDNIGGNEQGGATKISPSAGFETPALASLFQEHVGASSSSPPPSKLSNSKSSKSSHIGKIIGGVVGGVGALAIIIGGVLLLKHRRKTHEERQEAPACTAANDIIYEVADGPTAEVFGDKRVHTHELPGDQNL